MYNIAVEVNHRSACSAVVSLIFRHTAAQKMEWWKAAQTWSERKQDWKVFQPHRLCNKWQENEGANFVFWQDKSIWSTFTGYISWFFSNQICFLTGKIQKIELNFVFWQVKSNKFICICVLTGKIQQIDLNFCFDMKIQINLFEFVFWQRKSI